MDTLQKEFSIKTNHVTYNGLRMTILADLKRYDFGRNGFIIRPMIPINIKMFVQTKKGSKPMYDILNTAVVKPKGKDKWARQFEISDKQWKTIIFHF